MKRRLSIYLRRVVRRHEQLLTALLVVAGGLTSYGGGVGILVVAGHGVIETLVVVLIFAAGLGMLALAVVLFRRGYNRERRFARIRRRTCSKCAYTRSSDDWTICPECGEPWDGVAPPLRVP